MAGQSKTIRHIADVLRTQGWTVFYVCAPNKPHTTAVPINTPNSTTRQRYPDVVSSKGNTLRLTEVEISLSMPVVIKTTERFTEMQMALSVKSYYAEWRSRVAELTSNTPPANPIILPELILCNKWNSALESLVETVRKAGIRVQSAQNYIP